jgi:hypothetical protein
MEKTMVRDLNTMKKVTFTMEGWKTLDENGGHLTDAAMARLVEYLPGLPVFDNFDYSRVVGTVHFAEGDKAGLALIDEFTSKIKEGELRDSNYQVKLGYCGRVLVEHTDAEGNNFIDLFEPFGVSIILKSDKEREAA